MSDIDVEAVEDVDAPRGVDAPEFVLYGGKGGVGKTTCAAATALASARDDTATLILSTDPAHSLSDTFDVAIPAEPTEIRDDIPLYAAEIDPEAAAGDGPFGMDADLGGLGKLLGGGAGGAGAAGMGGPFGGNGATGDETGEGAGAGGSATDETDPLVGSLPGADEAAAMQLLLRYVEDDRFDRVVLDTAPTGHTLRLLELPETMDSFVGRLLKLRERFSGMLSGLGGMFGGDQDPEDVADDAAANLEELQYRIERLRTLLRDPERTDFRIVMVPEELSVAESTRLLAQLREYEIPVETIVVNRVLQDLSAVIDVEGADGTPAADADIDLAHVGPNHEDCEFCARRWDVQQRALASAQDLFQGRTVKRVPLLAEEVRGERLLGIIAACLD